MKIDIPERTQELRIEPRYIVKVKEVYGVLPEAALGVGVDPGKNFGVAIVSHGNLHIFWGSLPDREDKWQNIVDAYNTARVILQRHPILAKGVIEGAAFGAPYGQPFLGALRAGYYLGLTSFGVRCTVVPPMTIRKAVLGSGKMRGRDVWPDLNPNASDAVVCALHAAGLTYPGHDEKHDE